MKIIGHLNEDLIKQTESRYENVWTFFSLILTLCGIALSLHYMFVEQVTINIFMIIFTICIVYSGVIWFVKLFKSECKDKTMRVFDLVDIIVGSVAAYSLCAAACLITSNVAAI